MLKKQHRLTSQEVTTVLSKGRSVSVPLKSGQKTLISAKFLAGGEVFKVSVVAAKSVAKGAVARNRLRRAVYRAIASCPKPKKPGTAVLFVRSIPPPPLTPAFLADVEAIFNKISA